MQCTTNRFCQSETTTIYIHKRKVLGKQRTRGEKLKMMLRPILKYDTFVYKVVVWCERFYIVNLLDHLLGYVFKQI